MQLGEIGPKIRLAAQEDVEADKIQEREIQIISRRIVDVSDELARRRLSDVIVELFEETSDRARPMPAHDLRRDLIADGEREHCGVIAAAARVASDLFADLFDQLRIVEKAD